MAWAAQATGIAMGLGSQRAAIEERHRQLKCFYDLSDFRSRSFNAIAQTLITHLGQGRIEYIPFPEALRGKYQSFTQADVHSLRAAGYTAPFTELEAGIAATLAEI